MEELINKLRELKQRQTEYHELGVRSQEQAKAAEAQVKQAEADLAALGISSELDIEAKRVEIKEMLEKAKQIVEEVQQELGRIRGGTGGANL